MTGTYRLTMRYEKDGPYNWGTNGRKARAKNKNIDRRIKRREHDRITREAVSSWEQDAQDDRDLMWNFIEEEIELFEDLDYQDYLEEMERDQDRDYYDGYYEDYAYFPEDDYSYSTGSLSQEGLTHLDMNARVIKPEDCGKTLAEVLLEIETRRGIYGC